MINTRFSTINLNQHTPKKVIIIGAGLAGLNAAKILKENQYDVKILEASDRIGGRVWTHTTNTGLKLENGANWIHGFHSSNPVHHFTEKAKAVEVEHQLKTQSEWDSSPFFARVYAGGEKLSLLQTIRLGLRLECISKQLRKEIRATGFNRDISAEKYIDNAALALSKNKGESERLLVERAKNFFKETQKLDYAEDLENFSLITFGVYSNQPNTYLPIYGAGFPGGDHFITNGSNNMVNELVKGLREDIQTQCAVYKISSKNTLKKVKYTLPTGEKTYLEADYVICAVPLSILQAGSIRFNPPLPSDKISSLEKMGMGNTQKIMMTFKSAYWKGRFSNPNWIAIGNHDLSNRHAFLNVDKYISNASTLIGWAVGQEADDNALLSEDELKKKYVTILAEQFPECKQENLLDFHAINWKEQPYIRGAYSYIKTGYSESETKNIATPVHGIHFAGEHTTLVEKANKNNDTYVYRSTMHGALISGKRAAEEIISASK